MTAPLDWLLDGEPFVAYRTRADLLGDPDGPEAEAERRAMLADPRVAGLVAGLADWPGSVIASHKSAGQPFHRLGFLADLGLNAGDPGVAAIAAAVMAHRSDEGPFQLPMRVATRHGGTGEDTWAWALCDAPLVVAALARLGWRDEPVVRAAAEHLLGLVRDNGWPCALSEAAGSWRGPGRKGDPCPFANLAMLKAVAAFDDLRDGPAARAGAETLLHLWSESRTLHPYLFYMGTDFRKPKAPFVWYDILHVFDTLTRFDWLADDPRLHDMATTLMDQADDHGRFTAGSIWTAWKDWEFGQKRAPSRWITLLAWRAAGRIGTVAAEGAARNEARTEAGNPRRIEA